MENNKHKNWRVVSTLMTVKQRDTQHI